MVKVEFRCKNVNSSKACSEIFGGVAYDDGKVALVTRNCGVPIPNNLVKLAATLRIRCQSRFFAKIILLS